MRFSSLPLSFRHSGEKSCVLTNSRVMREGRGEGGEGNFRDLSSPRCVYSGFWSTSCIWFAWNLPPSARSHSEKQSSTFAKRGCRNSAGF